ncbi:MerR family transcriptional regulator [Nocardia sp. NPDC052566]|uniref:MerR family transcriptional regulator n=1 Tax=Nocardia sp. NPDC052566 TaxID=3364330 RepID=UPI0037C78361
MRIGDLERRTGVHRRLLRYYEEQRLLHPQRDPSGYRNYTEADVEKVERIRALLAAGLNTETIQDLLPCALDKQPGMIPCPQSLDPLHARLTAMDAQLAALSRQRDLLAELREATESRLGSRT